VSAFFLLALIGLEGLAGMIGVDKIGPTLRIIWGLSSPAVWRST
jgi:hypothetical protein